MEPEPKRRQLIPVVFDKNDVSPSGMCESTESGIYTRGSLKRLHYVNCCADIEETYYACIISEEENVELEKALKVSSCVCYKVTVDFV